MGYDQRTPGSAVIDLRDVVEWRDELLEEADALLDAVEGDEANLNEADSDELADIREGLAKIEDLSEWLGNTLDECADNEPTMILESYFEDYARELAEDVGYLADADTNPLMYHIDWAGWAEAVQQDYSEVRYDGHSYYTRTW